MSDKTNALTGLRRSNKAAILYKLMSYGTTSRLALSRELSLTSATVTQLVKELMQEGLVEECGDVETGRRGRKEIMLSFCDKGYAAIGVNIESDNTHVSLCTYREIIRELIFPTISLFEREDGLTAAVLQLVEESNTRHLNLLGVAVGIIGKVDETLGVSINSYGIFKPDYPLAKILSDKTGIEVELLNNVKAQARSLLCEQYDNYLFVKHSLGIGCALVVNGKTVDGANFKAGELGHTVVRSGGLECRCGKRGCLEAYASESHIIEVYSERTGRHVTISDVYAAYGKDDVATEILEEVTDYIALSLSNAATLLDPKRVLLTGGLFLDEALAAVVLRKIAADGGGIEVEIIGNGERIKAFAESRHLLLKKLFEV